MIPYLLYRCKLLWSDRIPFSIMVRLRTHTIRNIGGLQQTTLLNEGVPYHPLFDFRAYSRERYPGVSTLHPIYMGPNFPARLFRSFEV